MTRVRVLVVALLAVLVLGGCSGLPGASDEPSTSVSPSASGPSESSSGSASASPSARPGVPPAPKQAACYRLSPGQLTRPTNASGAVSCRGRHTAQTIYVGRLDTVVDGHAVAVDSATVQRQLSTVCPRKLQAYVGGSSDTRRLSRFNVVWYSPTLDQSDQGADWFRCDVIAFAGREQLAPLPGTARLRGVLDDARSLSDYGLCGTSAPGSAASSGSSAAASTRGAPSTPSASRAARSTRARRMSARPATARARTAPGPGRATP